MNTLVNWLIMFVYCFLSFEVTALSTLAGVPGRHSAVVGGPSERPDPRRPDDQVRRRVHGHGRHLGEAADHRGTPLRRGGVLRLGGLELAVPRLGQLRRVVRQADGAVLADISRLDAAPAKRHSRLHWRHDAVQTAREISAPSAHRQAPSGQTAAAAATSIVLHGGPKNFGHIFVCL